MANSLSNGHRSPRRDRSASCSSHCSLGTRWRESRTGCPAFLSKFIVIVEIHGSWIAFVGSWLLTMVSTLSIGMMVGGISKNAKTASVIACILYFPMLIFSGATLPFEVMPETMQKIVQFFPMTQGIQLMKATFLGTPFHNIWLPILVMLGVTILCFSVAVKCFKWE